MRCYFFWRDPPIGKNHASLGRERQGRLLRGRAEEREALGFIEAAFEWREPSGEATDSILVALLTSAIADAPFYRVQLEPTKENGLKVASQVMVDKIIAMPRAKCGRTMGLVLLRHKCWLKFGVLETV